MPILSKSELVNTIADKTDSSKASVQRFIDAFQETIVDAVVRGEEVKLTGFAAFGPSVRSARTMKNPQTGETIDVPEMKIVKIRPLGSFRDAVKTGNSSDN